MCVAQSALGLKAAGFRVVVVEDAVATPPPHHAAGILRLRDAGVTVTNAKAAYYELVRDVPTVARVAREIGGAPVVGEDATNVEGCASDRAHVRAHYTRPPLFFCFSAPIARPRPRRRPWLARRAAARASSALAHSRTRPGQCPVSRGSALVARYFLFPLLLFFPVLIPAPTPPVSRVAELVELGGGHLSPASASSFPNLPTSRRSP